ncbi:hypothetical protein ABZ807_05065 [Micromonospora sp. NPDC047548]
MLKYQEQRRQERRQLLQRMTAESLDMGLYDLPADDLEEGNDNRT